MDDKLHPTKRPVTAATSMALDLYYENQRLKERVAELETELADSTMGMYKRTMERQQARVVALEKALRDVIDPVKPRVHGYGHGLISTCQYCSAFERGIVGHSDIEHHFDCPRQHAIELLEGAE